MSARSSPIRSHWPSASASAKVGARPAVAVCLVAACAPGLAGCEGGMSSSTTAGPVASSTSGTGGGAIDTYSDEFDDASSIVDWPLGPSEAFDLRDIDTTTPGHFTVVIGQYAFWQADKQGFFVFKTVTGDFAVRTRTAIDSIDHPGVEPTGSFHTAGILVRDPASDPGSESWIMFDLGKQNAKTRRGTRLATTTSGYTEFEITGSTDDATSGELVVCRVGDTFHFARKLDGESSWTTTEPLVRGDLPPSLQVGLAANAGFASNPDLVATFAFARLTIPSSSADCIADR